VQLAVIGLRLALNSKMSFTIGSLKSARVRESNFDRLSHFHLTFSLIGFHHAIDYELLQAQALHIATRWFLSEPPKIVPSECDFSDKWVTGWCRRYEVSDRSASERKETTPYLISDVKVLSL